MTKDMLACGIRTFWEREKTYIFFIITLFNVSQIVPINIFMVGLIVFLLDFEGKYTLHGIFNYFNNFQWCYKNIA